MRVRFSFHPPQRPDITVRYEGDLDSADQRVVAIPLIWAFGRVFLAYNAPLGPRATADGSNMNLWRWRPQFMKKTKADPKDGRRAPKSVLRLPDLEVAKSAVLNSLSCPDAQRGYRHAIDEFVDWYCSEPRLSFSKTVVVRYRMHLESRHLAPGTINLRLGAVRRLAYEASDCGLLSADLAAGIRRVKGVKKLGVRLGNWLTAEQGQALWQAPDRGAVEGQT